MNVHTLVELQELGAILGSLQTISVGTAMNISRLVDMSEAEQSAYGGPVIVDDAKWVATVSAIPAAKASNVYSSDGIVVGRWQREKRTFYVMQLKGDQLVTTKSIIIKEEKRMTELQGQDLNAIDMDALAEEMGKGMEPVNSFQGEGAVLEEPDKEKPEVKGSDLADAVAKIGQGVAVETRLPDSVILNNCKYGRMFGFVTGTDATIKLQASKVAKKDADGREILNENATADDRKKVAEKKRVAVSVCETERELVWRQVKPSAIKAAIIGTPVGTDIPLTAIGDIEHAQYNMQDKDLKVYVMGIETAYAYVAFNYCGKIKESDAVLGNRASMLTLNTSLSTKKNNSEKVIRRKFSPERKDRTTLLVDGNYFPLKVFQTISTQDVSEEDKAALNLNIEGALKKFGLEELTDESRSKITAGADGTYTSTWFNNGAPFDVPRYDNRKEMVMDVRIPRRSKEETKEKKTPVYKFLYHALDDKENGPLANPLYAEIVKAANFEQDAFIQLVEAATSRAATVSKKKAEGAVDYDQYLRAMYGGDAVVTNRSLKDIQMELDQLA